MSQNIPEDLLYTESHEWIRVENDIAIVGITDHAQQQLTDIVFAEAPSVDAEVKRGEACAVVESTKAASDVYSPVSGIVTEANEAIESQPELINSDPYGEGWLYKIRIRDSAELDGLLTPEKYQELTAE